MNAKQMLAVAVVAIMAVAGVGAAFAYTATTTNVDNDMATNYLTVEQGRTYFGAFDDGKMIYDTLNGYFYDQTSGTDYYANQYCVNQLHAEGKAATETEAKVDPVATKGTAYAVRTASPSTPITDNQNYAVAMDIKKKLIDTTAGDADVIGDSYVLGWSNITIKNSEDGKMPAFKLKITATNLNLSADDTSYDGKYNYYAVLSNVNNSTANVYTSLTSAMLATSGQEKAVRIANHDDGVYGEIEFTATDVAGWTDEHTYYVYLVAVPDLEFVTLVPAAVSLEAASGITFDDRRALDPATPAAAASHVVPEERVLGQYSTGESPTLQPTVITFVATVYDASS